MKVDGWSMRDAGIADGDELVVDRSLAPEDGRIVVAEVDGLLTVKRLTRSKRGWLLQACNPEYADIPLRERSDLQVWGVVTHVLRAL
jgi:DNA polymerase V